MLNFPSKIVFNLIILFNAYKCVQSIIQGNKNNVYHHFTPVTYSISSTNQINSKLLLHNQTRVNLFQENHQNYQQNPTTNYNMQQHELFVEPNQHHLEDKFETQSVVQQILRQKPELSPTASYNMFDTQRQKGKSVQDKTIQSSNDHLKKRHLAEYEVPSPTILEMPPNLHHHLPLIIYKTTTKTMSHATTGNEPSPVTTEPIKTFATIKTNSDEKFIIKNKFNFNDNNFITASTRRSTSKQFLYSPLRFVGEKELSYASNPLPYPPSFIFITTTEKPLLIDHNAVVGNKMPDFFTHHQFKSLWDSYIPSWQTMKFMQKFRINSNNNNLQTLAFTKDGKMKIEK